MPGDLACWVQKARNQIGLISCPSNTALVLTGTRFMLACCPGNLMAPRGQEMAEPQLCWVRTLLPTTGVHVCIPLPGAGQPWVVGWDFHTRSPCGNTLIWERSPEAAAVVLRPGCSTCPSLLHSASSSTVERCRDNAIHLAPPPPWLPGGQDGALERSWGPAPASSPTDDLLKDRTTPEGACLQSMVMAMVRDLV